MADIVKFKMPDGTEVSNDPRFYQKDLQRQLEEQQKALFAAEEPTPREQERREAEEEEEDTSPYEKLTGKELKKEAENRGLDYSGLTRKSQLVALLEENDAAQEEADSSSEEDDEDSEEEEE